MADFLVQEEDGTSRLQLEESTDDLLLEEQIEATVVGRFDPHINPTAMF